MEEGLESAFLDVIKADAKMQKVQLHQIFRIQSLVPLRGFLFFFICASHFGRDCEEKEHM